MSSRSETGLSHETPRSEPFRLLIWGFSSGDAGIIEALRANPALKIVHWFGRSEGATVHLKDINYCCIPEVYDPGCNAELYARMRDEFHRYYICHSRPRTAFYRDAGFYDYQDWFHRFFHYFHHLLTTQPVDRLLFQHIPHLGADRILYRLARELGIPALTCYQSLFPNRFFAVWDETDFGDFHTSPMTFPGEPPVLKNEFRKDLFYMRRLPALKSILTLDKTFTNKLFLRIGQLTRLRKVLRFQRDSRRLTAARLPLDKPFVYFPLHLQPELSSSILGGDYHDQVLAIEHLAGILPPDWHILVKENPKQTEAQRGPAFFQRLSAIPNLHLAHRKTSTYELLSNCRFVATITGTAGWEAISGGKPALVFGRCWYQSLPGVTRFSPDLSLEDILRNVPDHDILKARFSQLYAKAAPGIVYKAYRVIVPDLDVERSAQETAASLSQLLPSAPNA